MAENGRQKIVRLHISRIPQIFLAGMPATGKTTISHQMCEKFGFRHISAGECLREEMEKPNSKLASLIRSYIDKGEIVPGHITLSLMRNKMSSFGWAKDTVIIDGFPRNMDNVQCWVKDMSPIVDVVHLISFECSMDVIRERLKLRTTEIERSDDTESVLRNRMRVYHEETKPVVLCFIAASKCATLNADRSREEVWEDVHALLLSLGFKPRENHIHNNHNNHNHSNNHNHL